MKKQEKMVLMSVRLYKKDKQVIHRAARRAKMSESSFVRKAALGSAEILLVK